jgi:hypothetical protein
MFHPFTSNSQHASTPRLCSVAFILTALIVLAALTSSSRAEQATRTEMDRVGQNWLTEKTAQLGDWAGTNDPQIISSRELRYEGRLLARIYDIAPRGYIVVPVLKEMTPVKMYSDEANLDAAQEDGPMLMLKEILSAQMDAYEQTYGSLDYVQQGEGVFDPTQKVEWDRYAVAEKEFRVSASMDALAQGGPLTTTSWHQRFPYNAYCPEGQDGQTVVGCVATALAQVLAYWQWPSSGVGTHGYLWGGDNSCDGLPSTPASWLEVDFSDTYDWANIVDNCDGGCDLDQQAALAELNYEAGVALEMNYGSCGSGAYTGYAAYVFPTYFKYSSDAQRVNRINYTQQQWFDLIRAEIDAGRVIQYRINLHSIVCDGYRDDMGYLEYHMNYGWNDSHNAWYVLDNLYCYWIDGDICPWDEEYMITGIHPQYDPVLQLAGQSIDDAVTGDGNGRATAGETVQLALNVKNLGNDAANTACVMTTSDPYITINTGSASCDPVIVWGGTGSTQTPLEITVGAGCPDPYVAQFDVEITADGGHTFYDSFSLFVGSTPGLADDAESGEGFWTHHVMTSTYVDQWHLETYRAYSGSTSWKHGGPGAANYSDNSDGCLLTPPFLLPPDAKLTFQHWIATEDDADMTAWDGAVVMISDGSGDWTQIDPEGGYPYTVIDNAASPFDAGTPCYSGYYPWQPATFDLSAFSGVTQLMFRFGSDGSVNAEGWYVDDILVCNTPEGTAVSVEPLPGLDMTFATVGAHGNTLVSVTGTGAALPAGWAGISDPVAYYEPTTTAAFSGDISVCLDYDDTGLPGSEGGIALLQYVGDQWVDITSSLDVGNNVVCGATDILAPLTVAVHMTCCQDRVGDVNGESGDEPTIGDISAMIDMLFISVQPVECLAEADINQSGGVEPTMDDITVGDISILIDYLFITGSSLGLNDCL